MRTKKLIKRVKKCQEGGLTYFQNYFNSPQYEMDRLSRANQQLEANTRERTIARNLVRNPTIPNLVSAAYHYYKSIPTLGGEPETGVNYITGTAPTPGKVSMKNLNTAQKLATKNIYKQIYERMDKSDLELATKTVMDKLRKSNIPIINGQNGQRYIQTIDGKVKSIASLILEQIKEIENMTGNKAQEAQFIRSMINMLRK